MARQKKIVVFSGAGMSAESGLKTFRDSDGLWENYNVMEVATPEAWEANPEMVLEFYNKRREQVIKAQPNDAHTAIAKLEAKFEVEVITQNIDNLHERAGSTKVTHLHGELLKSRSTAPPYDVFDMAGSELNLGDVCPRGFQLRPHVVWFGEAVPMLEVAQQIVSTSDIFIVVGTSLNVYPAASLVYCASDSAKKYLIDPKDVKVGQIKRLKVIREKAGKGVSELVEELMAENRDIVF